MQGGTQTSRGPADFDEDAAGRRPSVWDLPPDRLVTAAAKGWGFYSDLPSRTVSLLLALDQIAGKLSPAQQIAVGANNGKKVMSTRSVAGCDVALKWSVAIF